MKTLVTGANGHIGCHVVRAARDAGMSPVAFVREKSDRRGLAGLDVEVRTGDVLDAGSVARAMQGDPVFLYLSVTDVRDVASAHVLAATKGQKGRRYIATGDVLAPKETAALFSKLAGVKPPTFTPPRVLASFLAGRMEKKATLEGGDAGLTRAMVKDALGRHLVYDSSRARTELGATFRPAEQVLRDTFRWLLYIEALVPKTAAKVRRALGEAAAPDADWTR